MKKFLAIILTLAFAANLTACSKTPSEGGSSGDPSDQPGISQTDSSDSSDSTDSSDSEPDSADSSGSEPGSSDSEPVSTDVRALIDAFPEEEFTAPDGSTLKRSDAVKAAAGGGGSTIAVGYDFSYIRYAKPVWGSSADDPNFINWDTLETSGDPLEFPQDAKYFKVKAGDKLENGLTVKKAEYYYGRGMDGTTYDNNVEFDGELSLEGILFCVPSDEYVIAKGDILFFADPTKYDKIPMPIEDFKMLDGYTDTDVKFSVEYDGKRFQLGNINTLPDSVSQLLDEENAVRVRVTLSNIKFRLTPAGEVAYAEIVSAEKV